MAHMKAYPRIGLLNSEGDILVAYKTPYDYMIMDQWGVAVDILDQSEFTEFINGERNIIDSKERVWNYRTSHPDMKPNPDKLEDFLKLKVEEQS